MSGTAKDATKLKQLPVGLFMPEMSIVEYSRLTGFSIGVIKGHIANGYLPIVKRGKRRAINTAKIYYENIQR